MRQEKIQAEKQRLREEQIMHAAAREVELAHRTKKIAVILDSDDEKDEAKESTYEESECDAGAEMSESVLRPDILEAAKLYSGV